MLTQPTTDKILLAIANDLNAVVLPAVDDEQAKVLLGQIDQLLRRLSRRSATEIAWMTEEINAINEVLGREDREVTSLLLADVAAEYSEASGALGDAIDEAFAANDEDMIKKLKNLLSLRIEKEQEILGQLDLVGRG
ncbi:MAG: hypothetical protein CL455_06085 [Acidimicrobiaceae bacterium]|nr:hypothetical protein [Acidimicrobiaceae bacterium]|tara:strand:- start:12 stop:422 length:411 start_codon:yes stop_codon:yes gene_type:complete